MKEKESDIVAAILDYLNLKSIFNYRQNTGAFKTQSGGFYRFGSLGSPDIVCVEKGKYIGIEVKKKGGWQNPNQKEFEGRLRLAGGEYLLVHSLEEVAKRFP